MLKLLDCCSLQIGDKKIYVLPENQEHTSKWKWLQERSSKLFKQKININCLNNIEAIPKTCDKLSDDGQNHNDAVIDSFESATNVSNDAHAEDSCSEYEDMSDGDPALSDAGSGSGYSAASVDGSKSKDRKGKRGPSLATKLLKKKKLKRAQKKELSMLAATPKPGDTVVVEVLSTRTVVDVMWQVCKILK